jgi:hypothetical protein
VSRNEQRQHRLPCCYRCLWPGVGCVDRELPELSPGCMHVCTCWSPRDRDNAPLNAGKARYDERDEDGSSALLTPRRMTSTACDDCVARLAVLSLAARAFVFDLVSALPESCLAFVFIVSSLMPRPGHSIRPAASHHGGAFFLRRELRHFQGRAFY